MELLTSLAAHPDVVIRHIFRVAVKRYARSIISRCTAGVLIAIVLPNVALATTIVAIIDSDQYKIILGADSLITSFDLQWGQAIGHYRGCKIVVMPDCVAATAGLTFSQRFTFDLHRIARRACTASGDLHDKADTFTEQALQAVRTLARQIRKISPAIYGKTFIPGQDIVQAVFAGVQNRHLSILGRAIFANETRTIDAKEFDALTNGPTPSAVLGQSAAIIDYISADPDWNQEDTVNIVKKFLDMEVRARPDLVGPPVSILEIGQDIMSPEQAASKWLMAGACGDGSE